MTTFSKNMNQHDNSVLARVNPELIVIDRRYLKPTNWDCKAIVEDLREYVSASRLIKAMPVLRVVENDLKLVSGEPFIRVAREVEPPLHEVVCLIEVDSQRGLPDVVKAVRAADLMDEFSEDKTYKAIEMLTFTESLNENQRTTTEDSNGSFFEKGHASPGVYGGNYVSISAFDWNSLNTRVIWTWERSDQSGNHQLIFLKLLRQINYTIATLRSWNGLAIHIDPGLFG